MQKADGNILFPFSSHSRGSGRKDRQRSESSRGGVSIADGGSGSELSDVYTQNSRFVSPGHLCAAVSAVSLLNCIINKLLEKCIYIPIVGRFREFHGL